MKASYSRTRPFSYASLKARIAELGYTAQAVAAAGKMTASTYSLKLNGKGEFTQAQICDICDFLQISYSDIPRYFFAL